METSHAWKQAMETSHGNKRATPMGSERRTCGEQILPRRKHQICWCSNLHVHVKGEHQWPLAPGSTGVHWKATTRSVVAHMCGTTKIGSRHYSCARWTHPRLTGHPTGACEDRRLSTGRQEAVP